MGEVQTLEQMVDEKFVCGVSKEEEGGGWRKVMVGSGPAACVQCSVLLCSSRTGGDTGHVI
jgi:hypothetical protein